jgi:asparagine synthase (glutamine-hydrolysing)
MCGIAGFFGSNPEFSSDFLNNQASSLSHRGPDAKGFFWNGHVGFGFRRLSIIDVATGDQPCFSENKEIVSIFNGEIYNFQELRKLLSTKGHVLAAKGDSEIIPHLYEEFGVDFFNQLEGMFAITIWDKNSDKLILARDRFGEKPLWFEEFDGNLIFASEVKALMQLKRERHLDYQGIFSNLMFGYSGVTHSCITGVKMVPPASYISYQAGKMTTVQYWNPSNEGRNFVSMDEATDELEELLLDSIRGRLISERPLGIFLSGGIDSSLITALTSKILGLSPKTFSLGFEESEFDESSRATKTAKLLGTDHHETTLRLNPDWIFSDLPKILDYPFSDSSFLPTYFLSKFASEHVTVVLSGDGGDEGFGGYDRYRFNIWWQAISRNQISSTTLNELKVSNRRASKLVRALKFKDPYRRYISLTELISEDVMKSLIRPDLVSEISLPFVNSSVIPGDQSSSELLSYMQRHDLANYLPGDLMFKVDYASMAHGLEVRTPFLSHKVVEFGLNLPSSMKIGARSNKLILRNLASRYLDKELVGRKKMGFAIPRAKWIRESLSTQVSDLLLDSKSLVRQICRIEMVQQLIRDHSMGAERDEILWPLIILELWHQELFSSK